MSTNLTASEERIQQIENNLHEGNLSNSTVLALCEIARQLAEIARQLEDICP